jgi:hypothetical protein
MQNVASSRSATQQDTSGYFTPPVVTGTFGHLAQERQKNIQFVSLLNAFRPSGGLARAEEVAARFKRQGFSDVSPLAGWIIKRQAISVEWQSKIWLPLFQFNPQGMSLRTGLSRVLAELVTNYDDWELAAWFAQPNRWLADALPADALAAVPAQVLRAAHAELAVEV